RTGKPSSIHPSRVIQKIRGSEAKPPRPDKGRLMKSLSNPTTVLVPVEPAKERVAPAKRRPGSHARRTLDLKLHRSGLPCRHCGWLCALPKFYRVPGWEKG